MVNGTSETDTVVIDGWGDVTVEQASIVGGSGADLIRTTVSDVFFDRAGLLFGQSMVMSVDGGPNLIYGDRLVIVDDGTDDLVLYRKGGTDDRGTVTVGPGNAEPFEHVFVGIERLDIVDENGTRLNQGVGEDARLVVFKPDPFELNDDRFTATVLGANETVTIDPTIDPGGLADPFGTGQDIPGDEDWYRIEAVATGTLDLQVFFEEISTLSSGRPGLPDNGNLDIFVYDIDGDLVAPRAVAPVFGGNDGTGDNPELNVDGDSFAEDERIRIPIVAGQTYFLRVAGVGRAINNYSVTIVNTAAPTPFDLEVQDFIVHTSVTAVTSATQFTAGALAGAPATGELIGKVLAFTSGVLQGQRSTVTAFNPATGDITVAPGFTAVPAIGDQFLIQSVDTGRSNTDDVLRDNTPTIVFRLDDGFFLQDSPGNSSSSTPPDEIIPIPFRPGPAQPTEPGYAIAIFDEGATLPAPGNAGDNEVQEPLGFATQIEPGLYTFTTPVLNDGTHFLTARVQMIDPSNTDGDTAQPGLQPMTGWGARSAALEIGVDTAAPSAWFGRLNAADTTQGLDAASDSGAVGLRETFSDRITNDVTPTFYGRAEANTVVRVYLETNGTAGLQSLGPDRDLFLGLTVTSPLDGNDQFPGGEWRFTTTVDLNNPTLGLPRDGLRTLYVTAEDLAGNVTPDAAADSL
ncbi:MAG TPA: hypothetical protein EYP14_10790, partial [Planctomycetaceae bacterium]|nr:hypothetical protein [Planctomycetaceae bacterium]